MVRDDSVAPIMRGASDSTSIREVVKRLAPRSVRAAVGPIKRLIIGPGIEESVLRPYVFEPDDDPSPRLTLVIPSLSKRSAFGGVATGIRLFELLVSQLGVDARVVVEDRFKRSDSVLTSHVPVRSTLNGSSKVPTRRREVFLVYNWWTAMNTEPLILAQAEFYREPLLPKVYLVQEYEPQLYPFSSAHQYARYALDSGPDPLWIVFNSLELESYYKLQGHTADRRYTFSPTMSQSLRSPMRTVRRSDKRKIVLVYGRPEVDRNCFSILKDALRLWGSQQKGDAAWEFISAGLPHRDVNLSSEHTLRSVGKLSLDEYADLLRVASVGVSLMSSPHPSYPPLEMAHFGLCTITNDYVSKDMKSWHPNIVVTPDIRPQTIADTLALVIRNQNDQLGSGVDHLTPSSEYSAGEDFAGAATLVNDLREVLFDNRSV